MAGSSEAILELLAIPISLPGPLDSIREAQQHCASEQRQADEADDVNKSGMATRRAVGTFIRHYFLPPENPRKLRHDSNSREYRDKPDTPIMRSFS